MDIDEMFGAADAACNLMKALANPHRLAIVCQLSDSQRSVSELADLLKIRVSTVSQHLALLRRDGLVTTQRDGQTIWYSIGSAPARELINTLYKIYCAPASACAPAKPSLTKPSLTKPSLTKPSLTKPSLTTPSLTTPASAKPHKTARPAQRRTRGARQ